MSLDIRTKGSVVDRVSKTTVKRSDPIIFFKVSNQPIVNHLYLFAKTTSSATGL